MDVDLFIAHLKHERRLSAHTIKAYSVDIMGFFAFMEASFGVVDAKKIERAHARAWLAEMVSSDLAPSSIRRRWSAVSSYYYYWRDRTEVQSPLEGLKLPKLPERLPRHLRQGQIEDFIQVLPPLETEDWSEARDRALIMVLMLGGLRRQELIDLQVGDVRLGERIIRVLGKRRKVRLLPISDLLFTELDAYMRHRKGLHVDGPFFLTDKKVGLYPRYVYNVVMRYAAQVPGIGRLSPHQLRHTFATVLLDRGADINAIKSLLGHSNLSATQIYTHASIAKLKEAYKNAHPKSSDY